MPASVTTADLTWEGPEWRLLMNWWFGGLPSHRPDLDCQCCGLAMPVVGRRAHVAECAAAQMDGGILPLIGPAEFTGYRFRADELRIRASNDPITLTLWMAYRYNRGLNGWFGDAVKEALRIVATQCLGRE